MLAPGGLGARGLREHALLHLRVVVREEVRVRVDHLERRRFAPDRLVDHASDALRGAKGWVGVQEHVVRRDLGRVGVRLHAFEQGHVRRQVPIAVLVLLVRAQQVEEVRPLANKA